MSPSEYFCPYFLLFSSIFLSFHAPNLAQFKTENQSGALGVGVSFQEAVPVDVDKTASARTV